MHKITATIPFLSPPPLNSSSRPRSTISLLSTVEQASYTSDKPSISDMPETLPNTPEPNPSTSTTSPPSSLLEPKLTSQDQGQNRSRASSQSANSNASQASQLAYDPGALLNPKAAAKRSRTELAPPEDAASQDPAEDAAGMGSMIERMHGIQHRGDQPVKKQKRATTDEQDHLRKAAFEGGGKGTILGEYIMEQRKEGEKKAGPPPASTAVVDLTAG